MALEGIQRMVINHGGYVGTQANSTVPVGVVGNGIVG